MQSLRSFRPESPGWNRRASAFLPFSIKTDAKDYTLGISPIIRPGRPLRKQFCYDTVWVEVDGRSFEVDSSGIVDVILSHLLPTEQRLDFFPGI